MVNIGVIANLLCDVNGAGVSLLNPHVTWQRNVAHTTSEHDHTMTFRIFLCYLDQRRLKGRDAGGQGHTMKSAVYGRTSLSHGVTDRAHGHVSGVGIHVMTGRVIKGKSTQGWNNS